MFKRNRKQNQFSQEKASPKRSDLKDTPVKLVWVGTHPRKPLKIAVNR